MYRSFSREDLEQRQRYTLSTKYNGESIFLGLDTNRFLGVMARILAYESNGLLNGEAAKLLNF